MRVRVEALLILALMLALPALGQTLVCPAPDGVSCDQFHYHVLAWDAVHSNSVELMGRNSFSSIAACQAARSREEDSNAKIVRYLASAAPRLKYPSSHYGPCHCDMTVVPSSSAFLDDAHRTEAIRADEENRQALLAVLLDHDVKSDSDMALSLQIPPSKFDSSLLRTVLMIPDFGGTNLLNPEMAQLKETVVDEAADDKSWQKDLRLVSVTLDPPKTGGANGAKTAAMNPFVLSERARIQRVVSEILEKNSATRGASLRACAQRMQFLSKLDRLLQFAGAESRLSRAAADASATAEARLGFVTSLFGTEVASHWAPDDPLQMTFDAPSEIGSDPAIVVLDSTNRFTPDQRRTALFVFLMHNALDESDEPWIKAALEAHLNGEAK
ncbi:MAG: hypothetical protein ABI718_11155 [Acidobacteriota bacterium]